MGSLMTFLCTINPKNTYENRINLFFFRGTGNNWRYILEEFERRAADTWRGFPGLVVWLLLYHEHLGTHQNPAVSFLAFWNRWDELFFIHYYFFFLEWDQRHILEWVVCMSRAASRPLLRIMNPGLVLWSRLCTMHLKEHSGEPKCLNFDQHLTWALAEFQTSDTHTWQGFPG